MTNGSAGKSAGGAVNSFVVGAYGRSAMEVSVISTLPQFCRATGSVRCPWLRSNSAWSMCLPMRMDITPSPYGTDTRNGVGDSRPVIT